jgi:UDP-N-acetylglucosamine 2-epimerase (non-hydrolysing)
MIGLKRVGIVVETSRLIEDQNISKNLIAEFGPGGDGHAAERIVQAIRHHFGMGERPNDYKSKATKPGNIQNMRHSNSTQEYGVASG